MQRRLVEELKELEENIQSIKDNSAISIGQYESICLVLNKLLSASDKSFEVFFKGKEYNFIYPTTESEKIEMDILRNGLIDNILKHCIVEMQNGKDTWWMVTAFASGIDTLDMQIEIVKEDFTNRVDDNGQRITALPLDMENYQINLQRPEMEDVFKDQALDL